MTYYPEEGIAVIVLANLNGTVTSKIARLLRPWPMGRHPGPLLSQGNRMVKEVLVTH